MKLVGKDAWDFIESVKDKIVGVSVLLIEEDRFKHVYNVEIEETDDKWFKDDFGEWDVINGNAYHVLDSVKFCTIDEDVTTVVSNSWYQAVKYISTDKNGNILNK